MSTKLKIYLACAIHGADPEFSFRNVVASALASSGHEVVRFFSDLPESQREGKNIYIFDMARVAESDVVVAILDKGSTGVGMELRQAADCSIPVVLFSRNLSAVSDITRDYLACRKMPEPIALPEDSGEALRELLARLPGALASAGVRVA